MKKLFKMMAILAASCAFAFAAPAHAGLIIGTADTGNAYPFMCNDSGVSTGVTMEYQQVYSSTAFSGTIDITSLTFYQIFAAQFGGTSTVLAGNYQISLSTTSAAVNGLSTTLANNVGSDDTVFFNGNLGGDSVNPSLTISGGSFVYDPTKGNLLIDIVATNQPIFYNGSGNGYNDADNSGALMSRAYAYGGSATGVADSIGLVTGFNVASVPEPSSVLLGGTARVLGMGVGLARRNRPRA